MLQADSPITTIPGGIHRETILRQRLTAREIASEIEGAYNGCRRRL